jgi:hypothetical protein
MPTCESRFLQPTGRPKKTRLRSSTLVYHNARARATHTHTHTHTRTTVSHFVNTILCTTCCVATFRDRSKRSVTTRSEHGVSTLLHLWIRYGLIGMGVRKSKHLATRHRWCTFGLCCMCHLVLPRIYPVLASCEPRELVQLVGGSGYCISAETAGIRFTTHGPPNKVVLVLEYCASMATHCNGSVSHELQCWLFAVIRINAEPLTLPVGGNTLSYSVVQYSGLCPLFYCLLSWLVSDNYFYHFYM